MVWNWSVGATLFWLGSLKKFLWVSLEMDNDNPLGSIVFWVCFLLLNLLEISTT